jgi:ADP-ribose pyrophosphatase YjhB (NUDIX family)
MPPRFCIACGTELATRELEGRPRQICPACDHVAYENPVPAAAVVVRRGSGGREVLLVRRTIEPYAGQWGLPAGYQEVDETIETAAVREVREETGLMVKLTGLIDVFTTPDDPRKPSILVVYEAEEVDGELEPGDECSEVAFVSLDELPEELAFANNRVVLRRLRDGVTREW